MENLLTEIDLRQHLGYGDMKVLMEKTGCTRGQINWVIDGNAFNDKIIEAISDLIEEKKARKTAAINKLRKAIS